MNWRIECQTCAKAQGVGCGGVCIPCNDDTCIPKGFNNFATATCKTGLTQCYQSNKTEKKRQMKLRCCPFCGNEVKIDEVISYNKPKKYCILCDTCCLDMIDEDETELVKRWNSRSACAYDEDKNPLILVEDGSVDVDKLKEINLRPIVYKQGAPMPVIIQGDKRI